MYGVNHIDGEGILRLPDGTHTPVTYDIDMFDGDISIRFDSRLLASMMAETLMQKKPIKLAIDVDEEVKSARG